MLHRYIIRMSDKITNIQWLSAIHITLIIKNIRHFCFSFFSHDNSVFRNDNSQNTCFSLLFNCSCCEQTDTWLYVSICIYNFLYICSTYCLLYERNLNEHWVTTTVRLWKCTLYLLFSPEWNEYHHGRVLLRIVLLLLLLILLLPESIQLVLVRYTRMHMEFSGGVSIRPIILCNSMRNGVDFNFNTSIIIWMM